MARDQTGAGLNEERRARNVEAINNQLAAMQRTGAILAKTHRIEQSRDGSGTVDLWEVEFPGEDHGWTYSYIAMRALLKGYRIGCDYGRAER